MADQMMRPECQLADAVDGADSAADMPTVSQVAALRLQSCNAQLCGRFLTAAALAHMWVD